MSNSSALSSLAKFSANLRTLPTVVAQKVAAAAAPLLTEAARETFGASEDAYGDSWSPGADGKKVTLKASGRLASKIHYVAIGTKLRVALGVSYAKYQVFRRPVTPRQGEALPVAYVAALSEATAKVCRQEMGK
jgi:hypothetical protein